MNSGRHLLGVSFSGFDPERSCLSPSKRYIARFRTPLFAIMMTVPPAWGGNMRRRDVVKAIASLAATWPLTTRAQQPRRAYRLAILAQTDPIDILTGTRGQFWTALFEELRRLGYYEGRI
jgi:hypothetical protein